MGKEQINVLMIIGSLGDGGKERQLLLLLKSLKENKNIKASLMVMNSGGERENEAEQITDNLVVIPGWRGINLVKPLKTMIHHIKQNEIDIIHTWGSGIWDLIGLIAGRVSHKPVIHNGIRSAPSRLNIYNRLTRIGALFADIAVANSIAGLKSFKLANRPESRVIHNGLDTSRFEGVETISDGQNLCMVANFREAKDHKSVIYAMAEILPSFPDAKLYLVGHDYGTLSVCQNLIEKLEIDDKVTLFTNCRHPEPIIGKCQICILATNVAVHGEGISNALLEYMALSKPVIASINGGNAEVVVDNETGFLVEPGNLKAISNKLTYLLQNPDIATKMGARGKEYVNEQFSLTKMENEYMNLYKVISK